jgi:NAD+ kinase
MKTAPSKVRRFGLVANPEKPRTAAMVRRAAAWLRARGLPVLVEADSARKARVPPGRKEPASLEAMASEVDALLVFGGDGTMLRVARVVAGHGVAILGVNVGHLGFLTSVAPSQLDETLALLQQGRFSIDERAMLEATVQRASHVSVETALNDLVLSRGATSRLIELEVSVNDELVTRYRCDGLIVSSPTGSTAYSLSAGGSVVSPDAEVLVLTPICPHTLSIRPIVVSLASTVRVRLCRVHADVSLAADGQVQSALGAGDVIEVRRSRRSVRLIRPEGASFFATLRTKFGWSGGKV